jgi:hypothetical protein
MNATGTESLLNSWWINDADLAGFARTAYHAPALFAPINVTTTSVGTMVQHTISWGLQGQGVSQFTVGEGQSYSQSLPLALRYFWFDGSTVYIMDQHPTRSLPEGLGEFVTGKMYPPMLMAKVNENYVSQGANWFKDANMGADFASFKDLQCNELGP